MIKSIQKLILKIEIFTISFYRYFLSSVLQNFFKGGCRYEPSCSEYCLAAIKKYGPIKGLCLGVIRFLQCNPLSKHPREYPLI